MSDNTPIIFYSTYGIEVHAQRVHNSHWFDADSKRFFNSRVGGNVYPCKNPYLTLFVSSERNNRAFGNPSNRRYYSIRCYDSRTGNIETIGEFQEYKYGSTAHSVAKRIAPSMIASRPDVEDS